MPNDAWPDSLAPLFLTVGSQSRQVCTDAPKTPKARSNIFNYAGTLVVPDAREVMFYAQVRFRNGDLFSSLDEERSMTCIGRDPTT